MRLPQWYRENVAFPSCFSFPPRPDLPLGLGSDTQVGGPAVPEIHDTPTLCNQTVNTCQLRSYLPQITLSLVRPNQFPDPELSVTTGNREMHTLYAAALCAAAKIERCSSIHHRGAKRRGEKIVNTSNIRRGAKRRGEKIDN